MDQRHMNGEFCLILLTQMDALLPHQKSARTNQREYSMAADIVLSLAHVDSLLV